MSYFLKLNLPANPLRYTAEKETQRIINGGYNLVRPHEILSDELLTRFDQLGLKPTFVTLFGRNNQDSSLDTRLIHTDIRLTQTGQWKKLLFGVNWEVEGSTNEFTWWDMSRVPEVMPEGELHQLSKYRVLNGIHYVARGQTGIPEGAVKLASTFIDGPTLVRTEIPHLTLYNSKIYNRLGISVRFDESEFTGWEQVLEKFAPIAKDRQTQLVNDY